MRKAGACFGLIISLAGVMPTWANDTNAVLGAGGLVFTKTDELRMEREDLLLSTERIRVSYVFRNLTDHDITTTVAFPMPDLDMGDLSEAPHVFHLTGREGDVVDFHVRVDGKEVKPSLDVRAVNEAGNDVTEVLRRNHLPLTEIRTSDDVYKAMKALRPGQVKELVAADAIYDDGEHPRWTTKAAYHWQQTFPANAVVKVEHDYRPVVGGGLFALDLAAWSDTSYPRQWCPDAAFLKAARALKHRDPRYVGGEWIEYVLKTGANWAGPIGHFRLEIAKGKADLVSTCPIPGLTLIKQGRSFVAEGDNYTPTTDLKVLFLSGG